MPLFSVWTYAQIIFGNTMVRDPATLSLGYYNPFKKSGKLPTSLDNEAECKALIGHVKTYLIAQKAKNRGKGGVDKPWCITLVDRGDAVPAKKSKVCQLTVLCSN